VRADPRLARRPGGGPRHAAGHPGADLHPFFERRPDLAHWLLDRRDAGDAIAQHGLEHRRRRRAAPGRGVVAGWPRAEAAEYPGLDAAETRASVRAGRRILELAGLPPRGFVAPGYAYTPALRRELDGTFDWWATLTAVRRVHGSRRVPALGLGTSDAVRRTVSPLLVGAASYLCRDLVRLDVHPADFDHPRHVLAVERVLRAARDRIAVTYDELAAPAGA
jgi:predicted deacetylase